MLVGSTLSGAQWCCACLGVLQGTFIRCDECPGKVNLCTSCFAKGRETAEHTNNHRYRIMRDDFPFFEDWTARDELALLDQLIAHGPSNWGEVARKLTASATECQQHFVKAYLEDPAEELLQPPSPEMLYRPIPVVYRAGTHDPPRPIPGSTYHRDMAGYCAARGDFQFEMYQNAEVDVASLDPDADEDDLDEALTTAVVQVYNDKLRERYRRKKIVQEHGLINLQRHMAARYRYDATLTHRVCEGLSVFAQVLRFQDYNKLFEGLHGHAELRQRIRQLQKYRHLGLRTFESARLYNQLQTRREKSQKQWKQFAANLHAVVPAIQNNPLSSLLSPNAAGGNLTPGVNQRRSAPPLDVVGLPGYDKLNEGERQLCSVVRLVPESYIDFRDMLISECRNKKGIRLAQARTLIKIDVNKTRKIFDYLLGEKLIYFPSWSPFSLLLYSLQLPPRWVESEE